MIATKSIKQVKLTESDKEILKSLGIDPKSLDQPIKFSHPERLLYKKKDLIPPSIWSERFRILTLAQAQGPWRNEKVPYLVDIMDAAGMPFVRTVIMCKSPQTGGTEAAFNLLGFWADMDPGPAMLVYPDEKLARENSQDRVQVMFKESPALKKYLSSVADDTAAFRIKLIHMPIYFAWARSVSALSNKPIRYLIFDETDKYPDLASKREADPISLGEIRTTTFRHTRKIIKISTPTTEKGPIWVALTQEAQVIFSYYAVCPYCGKLQLMGLDNLVWPEKERVITALAKDEKLPDDLDLNALARDIKGHKLAHYECQGCGEFWDDLTRDEAVSLGGWHDTEGAPFKEVMKFQKPEAVGFHLPSLISPFVSLSEIVADYLLAQGSHAKLRNFYNKHLAEPWKEVIQASKEEDILEAKTDLLPGFVPEEAVGLTCGVDAQLYGYWYVVRAWAADMTSWLVQYGFLKDKMELEELLFGASWPLASNPKEAFKLYSVAIDTGGGATGGDESLTEQTYWLIREFRAKGLRIYGVKGASRKMEKRIKIGQPLDRTPSGKPIRGGLQIISLDTDKFKDLVFERLEMARKGNLPGAAYLHKETGIDYSRHLTAEEKRIVGNGKETWVQIRKDNHWLDCEVYAHAAADPQWPGGGVALYGRNYKISPNHIAGRPTQKRVRRVMKSRFMGG